MSKCHNIEKFMQQTIEINTRWLLEEEGLHSIEELYLWSDQGRLEVAAIVVKIGKDIIEIMHDEYPQDTTLPINDADDEILDNFLEEHEIDDIYWGNYFGLPESLYRMEMIRCAYAIAENAKKRGISFKPDAKIGIMIEDEDYNNPETFAEVSRKNLKKLKPDLARSFLSLYYSNVDATGLL